MHVHPTVRNGISWGVYGGNMDVAAVPGTPAGKQNVVLLADTSPIEVHTGYADRGTIAFGMVTATNRGCPFDLW